MDDSSRRMSGVTGTPSPTHPLVGTDDTHDTTDVPRRRNTLSSMPDAEPGAMSGDTCRICRSEGTPDEPLFYPCKCSGSIKFVHQECLMEWLGHSHKKHCELCKTPFRFTKLYDAEMPNVLPWDVFLQRAAVHIGISILRLCRGLVVAAVWLVALPWLIRWTWRWMFWFADAGWAREAFLQRTLAQKLVLQAAERASKAHTPNKTYGIPESLGAMFAQLWKGSDMVEQNATDFVALMNTTVLEHLTASQAAADSSVLSSWTYVSQLTGNQHVNRIIIDIFEGQLITCVVITGFILVFLIREWVVQQQPLVNLDNLNHEERDRERHPQVQNRPMNGVVAPEPRARQQVPPVENPLANVHSSQSASEAESQLFHGWDVLYALIDEATQCLWTPGEISEIAFSSSASDVVAQMRAAYGSNADIAEVNRKIHDKLSSLTHEETLQWRKVFNIEFREGLSLLPHHDTRINGSGHVEASAGPRRPLMPERHRSSQATQIQRSLEEADSAAHRPSRAHPPIPHTNPSAASSTDDDFTNGSLSSSGSWQHVSLAADNLPMGQPSRSHSVDDDIPIANAGPDAKLNIKRSNDAPTKSVLEINGNSPIQAHWAGNSLPSPSSPATGAVQTPLSPGGANISPSTVAPPPPPPLSPGSPLAGRSNAAPQPETADADEPEPGSLRAWMAMAFREEFGLERDDEPQIAPPPNANWGHDQGEANDADAHDDDLPEMPPLVRRGTVGQVAEWFWGDIQPPRGVPIIPVPAPPPAPAEAPVQAPMQAPVPVLEAVAPPTLDSVQINSIEQAQHFANDPAIEDAPETPASPHQAFPQPQEQQPVARDPEVVAAAQQAGLDAEAIEDAEDLEGIFELIGFQGPLIGLLQTSCFCSVLVTGTVFAAVGLPYLWGKLVLILIGHPISLLLKLPLQFGSTVADIVIDITLLIGGWLAVLITLAVSFLLSAVEAWFPALAKYDITEWISDIATSTASASGGRLQAMFQAAGMADKIVWNWLFLQGSVCAHASLKGLEEEIRAVFFCTGNAITSVVDTLSTGSMSAAAAQASLALAQMFDFQAGLNASAEIIEQYRQPIMDIASNLKSGALIFQSTRPPVDPTLVFWNSTDRALAVTTGYVALALIATVYAALDTPITNSQAGRKIEKTIRDTLKQAGGVLKVILIISIEMLVFPLYCGLLLDIAFLPLFNGASIATRWAFAVRSPYTFGFVHWFVGTCYMFHFALFVGMCRKILRKGVLWFIRDPDDPTFHPVRDVLERNVTTQLRKIAFSALVYGALVILCLGGVIWSIGHIFQGIFPIHWVATEPIFEFPMDMLLYNLFTPFIMRLFKPSDAIHAVYAWWLRRCARMLRLSHFLFDDQREDEQGRHIYKSWTNFLLRRTANTTASDPFTDDQSTDSQAPDVRFEHDGKYVLTPCNDQYRPPKPGEAFLHINATEMYILDHKGKKNEHFAQIYTPPYFAARITLFMVCLWVFSVFAGLCVTLVPLVVGRGILSFTTTDISTVNDIYAYSTGAYGLAVSLFILFHGKSVAKYLGASLSAGQLRAWMSGVAASTHQTLKCLYVYGFFGVVLPVVCALVLRLYFIVPLHTYMHSTANAVVSSTSSLTNDTMRATVNSTSNTTSFVQFIDDNNTRGSPVFVDHTIHLIADYALGLLYFRIVIRVAMSNPASRIVEAFRRVIAHGYFNPDVLLMTRFFVLPTMLFTTLIFLAPVALAKAAILALDTLSRNGNGSIALDDTSRTMIYRYSYPLVAAWLLLLWGSVEVIKATGRWQSRIRDEVYLKGERLHNFGEKKPPPGSKSVVRRDR